MPSQAALERGAEAAKAILTAHRDANGGTYPETVAVSTLTMLSSLQQQMGSRCMHFLPTSLQL